MHWDNNIIEVEDVLFLRPPVNRSKALFPEFCEKKSFHDENWRMLGVSFDDVWNAPVPDNTWDDA